MLIFYSSYVQEEFDVIHWTVGYSGVYCSAIWVQMEELD
jgi:hypothetical protein